MDNLSKLPERLKDLMDEAEVNAPALAKRINSDPAVITKFLRGDRLPSATTLVKLADFFHCMTDYIIGRNDILDDRSFKQRPPFNEQLNFLLSYYKISKYRLERAANVSQTAVYYWYKGKCEPTIESLIKLADHFDCSVDFILGRKI